MDDVRTWVEIDRGALSRNVGEFLGLVPKHVRFMAVVKSNAYGHGLSLIAEQLMNFQFSIFNFQTRLWIGIDSIVEGLKLRKEGIKNPILVLGATLPARLSDAYDNKLILTVSNFEIMRLLARLKNRPEFQIKLDTGMHRQGFLLKDIPKLLRELKRAKLIPGGIYTHFAAAKDILYPTYTSEQLKQFLIVADEFKKNRFRNLVRHAAASGGTLLFSETHLDMVRIGMGMYGIFPSMESSIRNIGRNLKLRPVLSWKTYVTEVKEIPGGSWVGYDLTERVSRRTRIAVLPVGYWHGFDRGLSGVGEVLIRGKRARVLGRVSMDMITVDVTDIAGVKFGDEAVLIGRQGKDGISAVDMALKLGTTPYEVLTRINPLIRRVVR